MLDVGARSPGFPVVIGVYCEGLLLEMIRWYCLRWKVNDSRGVYFRAEGYVDGICGGMVTPPRPRLGLSPGFVVPCCMVSKSHLLKF